jgi:hypothetical protein
MAIEMLLATITSSTILIAAGRAEPVRGTVRLAGSRVGGASHARREPDA